MNFFWSYQQLQSIFTTIKYGYLYNWYAATDSRDISSSDDWVIPSRNNFITMGTYLGGNTVAGGKLKETGLTYWNTPNTGATNEVGFNGRGAGGRFGDSGNFTNIGTNLFMQNDYTSGDQQCGLTYDSSTLFYTSTITGAKKSGYSIRLLYVGAGTPTSYTGNDGKIYRVVLIGSQYWLADNLAETKFRNGDYIHGYEGGTYTPISNGDWAALTSEGMCVYDDDESNM
mgnify:CR=1 FL=1